MLAMTLILKNASQPSIQFPFDGNPLYKVTAKSPCKRKHQVSVPLPIKTGIHLPSILALCGPTWDQVGISIHLTKTTTKQTAF